VNKFNSRLFLIDTAYSIGKPLDGRQKRTITLKDFFSTEYHVEVLNAFNPVLSGLKRETIRRKAIDISLTDFYLLWFALASKIKRWYLKKPVYNSDVVIIRYLDCFFQNYNLLFYLEREGYRIMVDIDDNPYSYKSFWKSKTKKALILKLYNYYFLRVIVAPYIVVNSSYEKFMPLGCDSVVIPNIVYSPSPTRPTESKSFQNNKTSKLLMVANFHWKYNIEGIYWFMNNVLPNLNSDLIVNLVGLISDELALDLKSKDFRIQVMGYVEYINENYEDADLVIIPVLSGYGSCVKTLEAVFMNSDILSTFKGVRGIRELGILDNIFTTDNPEEWVAYINNYERKNVEAKYFLGDDYNKEIILNKYKELIN
jgi:hypothetical protein